jgi:hypothetical protein
MVYILTKHYNQQYTGGKNLELDMLAKWTQ